MCDFTPQLQDLIQKVGIVSLKALIRAAGVSERQILRLRRGEVKQMRVDVLLKLSSVLQVSLNELVNKFSEQTITELDTSTIKTSEPELLTHIADLEREYSIKHQQQSQQREILQHEFQQVSLQLLESLLVQFPTAAHKARENPQLPAVNILPLVQKPLERLLENWGINAIASVGDEIPYDPQFHQLMEGTVQIGEIVKVRYIGYRQGEKLLYRAKVSKGVGSRE
jgi:molecular chaperone GrpE (heat shock protein)